GELPALVVGAAQAVSTSAHAPKTNASRRLRRGEQSVIAKLLCGSGSDLAGPGVTQRDAAVEHRGVGRVVTAVGDEITEPLELERLLGRRSGGGRLDIAASGPARLGVQMVLVGLAVTVVVGVGDREQAVVQADLGRDGVARADPVDG